MTNEVHPPSGLSKATWSDADFAVMGWHDCRIHAISIAEYDDETLPPTRLLLDLDYIVRWVRPGPGQRNLTFWVAPVTLVFERAWAITGALGPVYELLEIADLHRLDSPDAQPDPQWHIEGQSFDLRLRAAGYRQYFRQAPQHSPSQVLTGTQRGGPSFSERSFA
jgi:hypothetical protein